MYREATREADKTYLRELSSLRAAALAGVVALAVAFLAAAGHAGILKPFWWS